ncbi:hypothetical protein OAO42_00095 [Candidatus Izimaplasma bacterium]|nr:hypothetical protein [Candidatus Izimaplasma bacterium]
MNKVKFDKDAILEKSFEIAVKNGFNGISVRKVSQAVGCSTSPVYTAFKDIDGLISATVKKATDLIKEYVSKEYTDMVFLNSGVGLLVFARDYPKLYRELFVDNPDHEVENELRKMFFLLFNTDPLSTFIEMDELEVVLTKMWFFSHGIATSICSESIEIKEDNDYINILGEIGKELIISVLTKNGNLKEYSDFLEKENKRIGDRKFSWKIWTNNE